MEGSRVGICSFLSQKLSWKLTIKDLHEVRTYAADSLYGIGAEYYWMMMLKHGCRKLTIWQRGGFLSGIDAPKCLLA